MLNLNQLIGFGVFSAECLPWEVFTAVYANKSKDVSAQEANMSGIAFSADGTKMYILGTVAATAFQYTLSTAWDVSTATYASKSKLVSAQSATPQGIDFSVDGTKMYISDTTKVFQYTLSTAWDVSTATYASKTVTTSAQESSSRGIAFSADGTKMYIVGAGADTVFQYTLSTAWDVSTATYASKSKLVSAQETAPYGIAFSADGTKMYIVGEGADTVFQYTLSPAWDVSTATYVSKLKVLSSSPSDVAFSADGTKMYIAGPDTDTVYQYTLS